MRLSRFSYSSAASFHVPDECGVPSRSADAEFFSNSSDSMSADGALVSKYSSMESLRKKTGSLLLHFGRLTSLTGFDFKRPCPIIQRQKPLRTERCWLTVLSFSFLVSLR